jgi:hypothetical protein
MLLLLIAPLFASLFIGGASVSPFACDFEDGTMCGMAVGEAPDNFTVATGQSVSDKALGPLVDHTLATETGHFLYWYRPAQVLRVRLDGIISIPAFMLQPNLCLNFAYYIKSDSSPEKLTAIGVSMIGCLDGLIWSVKTIDSKGWQMVEKRLPEYSCPVMMTFFVSSNATSSVSVSVDDIRIDACKTTTATIPSTTTSQSQSQYTHSISILGICALFLNRH